MSITSYIKQIGRGKEGARPLTAEQAQDLMSQVLDGQVTDLQLGAFVVAMRIKGETSAELTGFLAAADARSLRIELRRPAVLLPSYNGSRKLPNLTALLALLLAQEGVQVLVHGPLHDPDRVTTAEIFHSLGLPCAVSAADIERSWDRHEPAFISIDALCPPLARLLAVRREVGLRNSGHTVAKLLGGGASVGGPRLRVVNYTHPEYATLLSEFLKATSANAVLLRGTEGEPVADPRRTPRLDVFIAGEHRADLSQEPQAGVLTELPLLPHSNDPSATALYIQSVVSGEQPVPAPLARQIDCIVRSVKAIESNIHQVPVAR